jgi:hypothetical protein
MEVEYPLLWDPALPGRPAIWHRSLREPPAVTLPFVPHT